MPRKCFVPIESWEFASPELLLSGKHTDIGLLAEALVLFDEIVLNVQTAQNLADVLRSFKGCFGDIQPFLELVRSGVIEPHYFDFVSAPIEDDGVFSYWNIQDQIARESHLRSFQQKILYGSPIQEVLPKPRHRVKLYDAIAESALIDGADAYEIAIDAARKAINSHEDLQRLLRDFVLSLPSKYKDLFPQEITVTVEKLPNGLIRHHFNINFQTIRPHLKNMNFGIHIPGTAVIQTHRIIYASRLHNYDVYLPNPIGSSVMAKLNSLEDNEKRFKQTIIELQDNANFPDIRTAFNLGEFSWREILDIRKRAERFRKWFVVDGGKPEVAIKTYSEEFKASTGLKSYREKAFAIASIIGTVTGAAAEKMLTGNTSLIGPAAGAFTITALGPSLGTLISNAVPLAKDLFKASEDENWSPRFFGTWLNVELKKRQTSQ